MRDTDDAQKKAPATACERFSDQSGGRCGACRRCVLGAATRKPPPPLFLPGVVTLITQHTGTPERPKHTAITRNAAAHQTHDGEVTTPPSCHTYNYTPCAANCPNRCTATDTVG
ncbi:hypothetical protein Xcc1_17650 [Xanthomonas campestris pv. campestris]|nr:hypothetical protein Xcc1_17650 [Xanthomonas campestris pv. campestris]